MRWLKRKRSGRAELIERKHQLEGEIRVLVAELHRRQARNEAVGDIEMRLTEARNRHYQTRLEIDRAEPGS